MFLIFGTIISSLILASCNSNGSSEIGKSEQNQTMDNGSFIGAWSYDDPFLGKVFLQFEADGTLRTYTNYEGEVIDICQWQLIGNKITVNSDCTFFNELEITDFEYGSFNIQANNNVSEGNGILHVARLFDEAGEPIRYYSLFERDTHSDPRYDNGSNNSEETTNNAANNESNSQSSSSNTNANPNAYQCSSCMFLSMGNDEPLAYENGGCNYLSFGKIKHGSHSWMEVNTNCEVLRNRNTIHYNNSVCGLQCRRCGQKTFILSITPPFGGSCPNAIGNGADSHEWKEF